MAGGDGSLRPFAGVAQAHTIRAWIGGCAVGHDGRPVNGVLNTERIPARLRRPLYVSVKAAHSLIFLVLQSLICYLLYKGLRGQTDRKAAAAAVIVGAECAIYAGNRFRCPLTGLVEDLGAASGSVTDIFLPKWLAANIARIYGPAFALALWLHYRNLRRQRADAMLPGQAEEDEYG